MLKQSVVLLSLLIVSPAVGEVLEGGAPLDRSFAKGLIEDALQEVGSREAFTITIDRPQLPLGNQQAAATEVILKHFQRDEVSGRFTAKLIGMVETTQRFDLSLQGRAEPLMKMPVLKRPLSRGEQVTASDIDWIAVKAKRVATNGLTDPVQLIGAEARRRLPSGRVLTEKDVGPPRLVKRGRPVRVTFINGGLRLTAYGTARDDGIYGEPVRVINTASRQEVQGIATAPDEVTIGPMVAPGGGY